MSTAPFRIGVISDTHGLLRPEALERLRGVDHILHAGDLGAPGIVEALGALAPVTAIRGNVDGGTWAAALPESVTLTLAGVAIHMVHALGDLDRGVLARDVRVVVTGHSHRPKIETREGVLYLNPGSAGPRRFRLPVTVARLTVSDGAVDPEILSLLPARAVGDGG